VTKENAVKKEKSGGCADAALAGGGGQNSAAGPALPSDKGGGKAVTKENAVKKEKSGGCADDALADKEAKGVRATGGGKQNPCVLHLPPTGQARHHAPRVGSGWHRIHVRRAL
jgi:hypothetical protein